MSFIQKQLIWGYVPSTVLGVIGKKYLPWVGKSGNRELMTYHKNMFPLFYMFHMFNVHNQNAKLRGQSTSLTICFVSLSQQLVESFCTQQALIQRRQWHTTPVFLPGRLQSMGLLRVGLHFHFSISCTGEGNGNPLQYSCLENPRDRGAWWPAVYEFTQIRTRLT